MAFSWVDEFTSSLSGDAISPKYIGFNENEGF